MENLPYIGEALSLFTAVLWAFAVVLFKRSGETVHPIGLNLFKNVLAFVLLIPTLLIFGEPLLRNEPISTYLILMLSGAIGIGIGDTLFFQSLNLLGAGLSSIVTCLYSPLIILLSVIFLGEKLTIIQLLGVACVVVAVLVVSFEKNKSSARRRDIILGIILGVIAALAMAVGVVVFKPVLDNAPLLWVTEVRLVGGLITLVVILPLFRNRKKIISSIFIKEGRKFMVSSSFVGAYLAMILWVAGMKYTQASIASALNQTSNVFIFIFAAFILHEKVTARRVVGIIIAFIGAALVSFG
ncbi:DMT family transporter [bacterium]|nr:DMT family transporter [bacterium]